MKKRLGFGHQSDLNQWFNETLQEYLEQSPNRPTLAQIRAALGDTALDAEDILEMASNDDEDAYDQHQEQMADDSSYRRQMIDAGRGHLLKG
jgi:hypothetical protein